MPDVYKAALGVPQIPAYVPALRDDFEDALSKAFWLTKC